MIRATAVRGNVKTVRTDVAALCLFEDPSEFASDLASLRKMVPGIGKGLSTRSFRGKQGETLLLHPEKIAAGHLLLVGLGPRKTVTPETLRRAGAVAERAAAGLKARSLAIIDPGAAKLKNVCSAAEAGTALAEGVLLSAYRFHKYKTEKSAAQTLTALRIVPENTSRHHAISEGLRYAGIVCAGTYLARDLANAPGNEIYPETLARRASLAGRKHGFRVTVMNERKIRSLGMGGLLAVARGSIRPPRCIIMEHGAVRKKGPTVVLVGKGVTFDAGGISIKPSQGMAEMKMDMSGGAAVIGTMTAIAALKLPLHVVGIVPTTENLLGGAAMKPGDILRHYNGKTSEVDNTDAEGRLILADALSYASRYNPDLVIDLATLTGACVVALGHFASGMMGNDQEKMDRLKESGDRTFERVWQLPLFEEYEKLIRSDVADVKNVGGRWGGAITAALFLKKFIGDYPWIHLDIAGPAMLEEGQDYIPRGGSGVGVRLLVDFLRNWNQR